MRNPILIFIVMFSSYHLLSQEQILNQLLQKHVSDEGFVNYTSFQKNLSSLKQYIAFIEKTTPNDSWSENKQKAFYINAYNAYTILLILHEYPLKSITNINIDGKTAWKIPFVKIGGKTMTLDFLEHEILQKQFDDPRIHVGINCASISCPKLSNVAFTEQNIESELERLLHEFVNDSLKNDISANAIKISAIFDWYKSDFTKQQNLIDFLNHYSSKKINVTASIQFLEYDWNLNDTNIF